MDSFLEAEEVVFMGIRVAIVRSYFVEGYISYAICSVFNKFLEVLILLLRALIQI